jgi:hypothetical protein
MWPDAITKYGPDPHPVSGIIPGDGVLIPQLYLPLANEATKDHNRYALAGNIDTNTLQSQIKAAMGASSRLTVPVDVDGLASAVVLNGATLPFVVITGQTPR